MSDLNFCACSSPTTITVAVPGPQGPGGTLPIATTADFIIPAVGAQVTVAVQSSSGFRINKNVFVDGSNFAVFSNPSSGNSITLAFLGFSGDGAVGSTVPSGSLIQSGVGNVAAAQFLPAGTLAALAAISGLANNTTGTAQSSLAAGVGVYSLTFPITVASGTSAADYVTAFTIGHAFKILSWYWITATAITGTSASRVFNLTIGSTPVGTVTSTCTVTIATEATIGVVKAATAVSGANTGTAASTLSVKVASGGTSITGGTGSFVITIQNMDDANAAASLNNSINQILAAF